MDNPFDLSGKTALVTGGNQGLGQAFVLGLAQAGARVAFSGRRAAANGRDACARSAGDPSGSRPGSIWPSRRSWGPRRRTIAMPSTAMVRVSEPAAG